MFHVGGHFGVMLLFVVFSLFSLSDQDMGEEMTIYIMQAFFIHDEDIKQPFFRSINTFFREFLSIGKYAIFYIYAIPFILCGFKFLKNFAIHAKWYFPLFLVSMLYFEEYEIRQALSFSFVFLFLDEFISNDTNGKKIIWCGVWVLLTFSLHSANIFFYYLFLRYILYL